MVAWWRLLVSCTMWQHPKAAATKALCASHHPGAPGEVKPRPEGRFLLGLIYRKNKHLKLENVWIYCFFWQTSDFRMIFCMRQHFWIMAIQASGESRSILCLQVGFLRNRNFGEGLDQIPWMSMDYGVSSSMNMPVLSNFGVYNFLGHSHM